MHNRFPALIAAMTIGALLAGGVGLVLADGTASGLTIQPLSTDTYSLLVKKIDTTTAWSIDATTGAPTFAVAPGMTTGIEFEGTTADAFETTLAVTDPTADRTVTVPNATGTIVLSAGATDVATAFWGAANSIVAEGATADAFEATLAFGDVTADRTWTFGAAGDFLVGGTATADPTTAGLMALGGTGMVFEGATADGFELTFTAADATADHSLAWGAAGTLTSSATYVATGAGLADPVTASTASYGGTSIVVEGSSADGFETTIAFANPTSDNTFTFGAAGQFTCGGTGGLGWTFNDTANDTACTTSCVNSKAVLGWDTGTSLPVDATDATADYCVCAGAV